MDTFRFEDYPIVISDGGRRCSKRPKQKNDCTVRAVVHATMLQYDVVYDILAEAGRRCGRGFEFDSWAESQPLPGFKFIRRSFPAAKGQNRMNPYTFCKQFTTGVFIVKTAKHVFTIRDGVGYDTFKERPDRCIYVAWEIIKL